MGFSWCEESSHKNCHKSLTRITIHRSWNLIGTQHNQHLGQRIDQRQAWRKGFRVDTISQWLAKDSHHQCRSMALQRAKQIKVIFSKMTLVPVATWMLTINRKFTLTSAMNKSQDNKFSNKVWSLRTIFNKMMLRSTYHRQELWSKCFSEMDSFWTHMSRICKNRHQNILINRSNTIIITICMHLINSRWWALNSFPIVINSKIFKICKICRISRMSF